MSAAATPFPLLTASDFRNAQRRVIVAIMICYLFYYTGRQNMGFAVEGMRAELGYTAAAIGALNAAMLAGYGLGQALNGNFSDMFGARQMVLIGVGFSVALNWGFSYASTAWLAVLLWFLNGVFQSTGSPALRRLIVNWFAARERGTANGLHLLSAALSSALTFALCIVVASSMNWRWIFRLPPSTLVVGLAVFLALAWNRPEDAGLSPLPPEESESPPAASGESFWTRYGMVARNGHFLLCCVSIGLESMARYGLLTWAPTHFGAAKGNLWVTLGLPLGMAAGALSAGVVADRWFPRRRAWVAAAMLAAGAVLSTLLAVMPQASPFAFVLLAATGFVVYAPQASYWSLGPVLVGRERSGTATGLMDAAAYGFAALGQIVIGAAIDATGSTPALFFVIAAACLLGALVILPVRK